MPALLGRPSTFNAAATGHRAGGRLLLLRAGVPAPAGYVGAAFAWPRGGDVFFLLQEAEESGSGVCEDGAEKVPC